MLLSTNLSAPDTGMTQMNAPLLRSPRFQSPPLQHLQNVKGNFNCGDASKEQTIKAFNLTVSNKFTYCSFTAGQNRSPSKNHNGRDNTESIDMEMSDEDFDTMPDFQSN